MNTGALLIRKGPGHMFSHSFRKFATGVVEFSGASTVYLRIFQQIFAKNLNDPTIIFRVLGEDES